MKSWEFKDSRIKVKNKSQSKYLYILRLIDAYTTQLKTIYEISNLEI